MGVFRDPQSPLTNAQLTQVGISDGVVFWDRTLPPRIEPTTQDESYIIEISDRHDLLATRKLGDPELGWAIMERNYDIEEGEIDMRLWPNDFVPGYTIKIPPSISLKSRRSGG